MRSYTQSKSPSKVNPKCIFWNASKHKNIEPDSNEIAVLLYISRKREIGIIYKPALVVDNEGNLHGIIDNMYDEGSTPAIIMIDGKEVGSCSIMIQTLLTSPRVFAPKSPSKLI
jgi:hypothetical protein